MKESIGGTWLFTIVIAFIALFTTFVSVTTNYARCFKIKDDVVDRIAANQGINEESITQIRERLRNLGYSSTGNCPTDGRCWWGFSVSDSSLSPSSYGSDINFCIRRTDIVPKKSIGPDGEALGTADRFPQSYYSVVIFFKLDWPILRQLFEIKVAGETPMVWPRDNESMVNDSNCKIG